MSEAKLDGWRIQSAKTSSAQAYERLRSAILKGEFAPGERLTEVAIAQLLDVSRTPVRDAFARLVQDGLVRIGAKGTGIEVVDPVIEFLDIYYIRESLEGLAARLAAMRATDEEIERVVALADESQKADRADVTGRARINSEFHLTISKAAHAPRLERLIGDYREIFASPHILQRYTPGDTRKAVDDHTLIATAIRSRNPDMAEMAMRDHLRVAYARVVRMAEQDRAAAAEAERA